VTAGSCFFLVGSAPIELITSSNPRELQVYEPGRRTSRAFSFSYSCSFFSLSLSLSLLVPEPAGIFALRLSLITDTPAALSIDQ
jgi:hypothetical protein